MTDQRWRPEMMDWRWRPDMTESSSTGSGGGSLWSFVPMAFLYIERSCACIMQEYNLYVFIDTYMPTLHPTEISAV